MKTTRRQFGSMMSALSVSLLAGRACAETELKFNELYKTGVELSEKTKSLAGQNILISGFMAPPLKADVSFFVLTKIPMAVCPFCDSEMNWPDDIILVLNTSVIDFTPFNRRIFVRGRLDVGFVKDVETGFVSFVRLLNATYGQS